jgi:carboxymethylenebutenolidase
VFAYPAGHGFNCEERDSYNEESAGRALERTLFMISQYVDGQPPVKLKNSGAYLSQEAKRKKKPTAAANDGPPD